MICDPCKIADTNRKQFSFWPNFTETGKIKLKPFTTDVNNYLASHKEELENYTNNKNREKIKPENICNNNNEYNYNISKMTKMIKMK